MLTAVNLSLVGDKDIVVNGDRIIFRNSGLMALVDQVEEQRVLTEPVDGLMRIKAVRKLAGGPLSEGIHVEGMESLAPVLSDGMETCLLYTSRCV